MAARHAPMRAMGIRDRPNRTSLALAERLCRTADRIDPAARASIIFIVLGEMHLRQILQSYRIGH